MQQNSFFFVAPTIPLLYLFFIFLMITRFLYYNFMYLFLCLDAMKDFMWCAHVLHARDYYIRRTNWFSNIPFQKIYILGIDVTY